MSRSVKAFAARATASLDRLDVLVENAGVCFMAGWHPLPTGVETQLQVNDISTGLLGVLLLPVLAKTAARPLEARQKPFMPHLTLVGSRSQSQPPWFLSLPSMTSQTKKKIADESFPGCLTAEEWVKWTEPSAGTPLLADLNDPASPNAQQRYAFSKLVSIFLARRLSQLSKAAGLVVDVVCPGLCLSELVRHCDAAMTRDLQSKSLPTAEGAKNVSALPGPCPPRKRGELSARCPGQED